MMKYQVICADWQEEFDSPHGFTFETDAFFAEDAVYEYVKELDENSNFVDDYPQDAVYQTKDENGNIESFLVSADFEPQFYIYEQP